MVQIAVKLMDVLGDMDCMHVNYTPWRHFPKNLYKFILNLHKLYKLI